MRGDKESTKYVEAGSIMQLDPAHDQFGGKLAIVGEKHPWGVVAHVLGEGTRRLGWQHLEPTGGKIVWDQDGKRLTTVEPLRHHP